MAEFDTSSYPRPQPAQNPLDQLTRVGQVADVLGNIEVGKGVQGAIQSDGSIDQNSLAQSLKGTVAGSMNAIPTLTAFEQLRQAGHVADVAGLDNFQKRMAVVNHLFGTLAAKDNPSINDVNSIAARVLDPALRADKFGLTFPVVMNALKNFRDPVTGKPLPAQEIQKRARDMQLMTAETSTQLEQLMPGYDVIDDGNTIRFVPRGSKANPRYPNIVKRIPTGTEVTNPVTRQRELVPPQPVAPEDQEVDTYGRPIPRTPYASDNQKRNALSGMTRDQMGQVTPTPENGLPATFSERFNPRMAGAPARSLRPGLTEAATSTAQTSAELGNNLTKASSEVPAVKGILDNMERLVKDFKPGQSADWQRVAKSFINTSVPESLGTIFDPKSIASQEEFNKQAYNLAQRQFQQLGGTGTDAKLHSAMSTSPSELITRLGNQGIIQLLKGNNDAIKVQSQEWNKWKKTHGEDTFSEFLDDFNPNFNPRVFQFKYVPKAERQAWLDAMPPDEQQQFIDSIRIAKSKGWVKKEDFK